jgi:trigger factor
MTTVEEPKTQEQAIIETFQGEGLHFEKKTLPHCKIIYRATPEKSLWEKARSHAVKKISKDISIPGFRKGKAPESFILDKYRTQIEGQTELELANMCFQQCQKSAKTPILQAHNNIGYHIEDKKADPVVFVFDFESEPSIPSIPYDQLQLKQVDEVVIDEKKIQEDIDLIRSFYATWEQITDRAVEMGDFLLLDIEDMDQEPPAKIFNSARFEVSEEKMAPWMKALVLGKNIGDVSLGSSQPDESASLEDKENFKEKKVRITIHGIEKSTLPSFDDAFAKKLGAENINEVKEKITHLLKEKIARERATQLRLDIEEQLIEKVLFDIPKTLLEQEANHRMSQLLNNPSFKKEWENDFTDEQKEAKKAEIRQKSTQAICLYYLCTTVVSQNHISVSPSDMETSFDSVLEMMYADKNKLQYKSSSQEEKQMALTQVMIQKAEDFIVNHLIATKK